MADGKTLTQICRERDWAFSEVFNWTMQDEERVRAYEIALHSLGEYRAHESIDIANAAPVQTVDKDGKPQFDENGKPILVEQSTNRDRLRVTTNLELAGKWSPRYRSKVEQGSSENGQMNVDIALAAVAAALMERMKQIPVIPIESTAERVE